jgi:hypothetical protein
MAGSITLKAFRGVSLLCLCIVGVAVVVAPLELVAYPMLKSIGCSLTEGQQSFTCGDGWVGHFISTVLNLPILFSDAREFTFGARTSFGRGFKVYLFDAIFILALAYPLLILFARKGSRRSG